MLLQKSFPRLYCHDKIGKISVASLVDMNDQTLLKLLPVVAILFISISLYGQDYEVDPTFTPQIENRQINTVEFTTGGKILVGGQFSIVAGVGRAKIARLNADGSLDESFTSPLRDLGVQYPDEVRSIKTLPDGKILIGGYFSSLGAHVGIARLNSDGTLDSTLTTKPFFEVGTLRVKAIPLSDGKFLGCGPFPDANGIAQRAVARFNNDGSLDNTFAPVFTAESYNPSCSDLTVLPDGKILIVGFFYQVNGSPRYGGVKLDPNGGLDPIFNATSSIGSADVWLGLNGDFFANYFGSYPDPNDPGGYIYYTGINRRLLDSGNVNATYNCNNYPNVPIGYPQSDGQLMIAGGCTDPWNNAKYLFARFKSNGSFDSTLDRVDFGSNSTVNNIDRQADGNYMLTGRFTTVNGVARTNIVRLRPKTIPTSHPDFDFDGDGKADLAVYRPSGGFWYIHLSGGGDFYMPWGIPSDKPVAADFDNDGKTDLAVFRDGTWFIRRSSDGGFESRAFGQLGDTPLVGHFSFDDPIDDKVDMVTRQLAALSDTSVRWRFRYFGLTSSNVGSLAGESISDKLVIADLDGDSIDEFGFYRNGYWKTIAIGGTTGINGYPRSIREFFWGTAGDIPVPADYDGDGQADYAVYRPSTGTWWFNTTSLGVYNVRFGSEGDVPVPADYDGDGKTDIAIYRFGQWWQLLSSGSVKIDTWGTKGDIPIPAQSRF